MASKRPSPPKSRARLLFTRALKIGGIGAAIGLVLLIIAVALQTSALPSFEEMKESPNGQMIRVRAADGSVLVSLGPSFGEWLDYEDIPEVMKEAMVAVEDRRFRSHLGIDPIGVARGIKDSVDNSGRVRGVSTITQQLARNIFLTNARSWTRKAREGLLALSLEWKFSKDQILELYLNRVYFGGGAYGIDAASRRFFGHPANELSLAESAIIAGLVKAPSNYSPTADAAAARERAQVVLRLMREQGVIGVGQAADADPEAIEFVPEPRQNSVRYFTDWALPQLEMLIDETLQPIEVWTTLDPKMQRAATESIVANTPTGTQGALVALDRNGAVRAMVGGKDYVTSIYNRATQATRQPGSAFKLFVYLSALESGYTPEDGVVDEPVNISGWSPRNDSGRYSGAINLRTAFAYSINTIAAKIGLDVGQSTIADMARRFGVTTPINTHPSMVLGTSDVRLIDMTRAFASVSSKGVAVTPFGITKVTTADGELLYEHEVDTSRVLVAPWVAAQMTDLMQTAVSVGTGRAAQIGRPVAGKTGTTSSNKDGWFLGFSSGITTGVWMGRDDARRVPGLAGGRAPAPAFADFMRVAVASRPVEQFETEVTLPKWQLEPDEEAYFGDPAEDPGQEPLVDENGLPIEGAGLEDDPFADPNPDAEVPERLDERFIDRVLGRDPRQPPRREPSPPPPTPRQGAPSRPQESRPTQ